MKRRLIKISITVLLLSSLVVPQVLSDSLSDQVMAQGQTETLRPNAPGDETRIASQYPYSGAHWDKVDEVTADEDATVVQHRAAGTSSGTDLYNIQDTSVGSGVINSVTVYDRWRRQGGYAYAIDFWMVLKTHGTKYSHFFGHESDFVTRSHTWTNNPFTGQPWTWNEINDLQIGVTLEYYSGVGWGSFGICTQAYAVVDYTTTPTNQAPIAYFDFSSDPAPPAPGEDITFDASFSRDEDSLIVSFDWDFDDGTTGEGARVIHAYQGKGGYDVTLTVTDIEGRTDSTDRRVKVFTPKTIILIPNAPGDKCGYASGGACPPSCLDHWQCMATPDGDNSTVYSSGYPMPYWISELYNIQDTSGEVGPIRKVTVNGRFRRSPWDKYHRPYTPIGSARVGIRTSGSDYISGIWTVGTSFSDYGAYWTKNPKTWTSWTWADINNLQIGTTMGRSGHAIRVYTYCTYVYAVVEYASLVAEFDWSPIFPEPFEEITFTARHSCSPGQIINHYWDFGDETTDTGESVTHYYQKAGEYNVTLTVVDDSGRTDTTTKEVNVRHWSLFETYAPVLYLHDEELFRTREIASMLKESDLRFEDDDPPLVEYPDVTTDDLAAYDADDYHLDMRNARSDYPWDTPEPERFADYQLTVYGREYEYANSIALQYWFFYPYNNWWNHHEGDWEMITIFVDRSTEEPYRVACAQHGGGTNYIWEYMGKVSGTQHPKIFIARGSHSSWGILVPNYFIGKDVISENGTALFPNGMDPGAITGIEEEDKAPYTLFMIGTPHSWVEWEGYWGEHTIWPTGRAPRSPRHQPPEPDNPKWTDPLAWSNSLSPPLIVAQSGSPVNLHAYDQYGNHVGLNEVGEVELEIPGTYLYVPSEEDEEVMIIYTEEDLHFEIEATGAGDFDFDLGRYIKSEDKEVVAEYEDVLITENTTATLEVNLENPQYIMEVDLDGDGTVDEYKPPDYSVGINEPPEADANGPYVGEEGFPLAFDASNSSDPDGDPLQYRWDFNNDGVWDTGWLGTATANYTWGDDFIGTAILEVSDAEFTDSDNTSVTVNNVAPIADAGPDQTVEVFDLVSLSGSATDQGWLDTHTFEWDFGDDTTAIGENVTHTYDLAGTYTVTLTVTDDDGGIGVDTAEVTVIQTYGLWANSTSDYDAIDWSGSNINVNGKVHSNNDIKVGGSSNTIDGATSYVASFNDLGDDNSYTPSPIQDDVKTLPVQYDLADYQPGGSEAVAAQAEGKYHYIDGVLEVSDSGVVLDGLYYVTGEVKLSGSNLSGQFTIVAEGDVSQDISGSEFNCRAYSGDLLFFCNGNLLKMAGSNSYFEGVVYLPNGEIELSGSENTIDGSVFGNTIKLSGSYINITAGQ